jgi:hypothetical protein
MLLACVPGLAAWVRDQLPSAAPRMLTAEPIVLTVAE